MNFLGNRRAPMNQDEFDTKFNYLKSARNRRHSDSFQQEFCFLCPLKLKTNRRVEEENDFNEPKSTVEKCVAKLKTYFPIVDTLLNYSVKEQLGGDLYAGVCLGLYTGAQSLTCAFLAGLPLQTGLYTAIFSTLLYSLFGTSTHSYLGPNLILCFFLRNLLDRFSKPHDTIYLIDNVNPKKVADLRMGNEQIGYAVTVTFLASIFVAVIFASRLRFLFSFISKHLLAGYTFGLTIRVLFSQINHILHVKGQMCISELSFTMALLYAKAPPEKRNKCAMMAKNNSLTSSFPMVYRAIEKNSENSECLSTMWDCLEYLNLYTLFIFICAVLAIVFVRQLLSPFLQLKNHLPIPFEFLLIAIATTLSYLLDVNELYDVEIAKFIDNGFRLSAPKLQLFRLLFLDAFALALLIYSIHWHTSNEVAKEQKYKLEERQETIALTSIGLLSSFFAGHPTGQSHNRNKMGVNADASSIIVNLFIFLVLLPFTIWTQKLFTYVPIVVFSAIIVNNTGEYLSQLKSLTFYWYISRIDVSIFVFAALCACFSSDASCALFLAIAFGLFTVVCRSQWPKFQQLVNVTGSGVYYAEKSCYSSDLLDEPGIAIVRFEASLLFHNTAQFCAHVRNACAEIKGQLLGMGIGSRAGSMKSNITLATAKEVPMRSSTLLISGDFVPNYEVITVDQSMTRVLILDFSSTPVADSSGLLVMRELFEELAGQKIRLLFACVNSTIRHRFKISGGFESVPKHYFYPSVQDAVLAAQQMAGPAAAPNFHMSVSMNGCRDIINLSSAPSNQDFISHPHTGAESRMSIVETRFTPPLSIKNIP